MSNEPTNNGRNGRDSRGRFAAGNPGGPGRGPGLGRKFRGALADSVDDCDVRAIMVKTIKQALGGNLDAAKLVLAYVVGRPSVAGSLQAEEMLAAFSTGAELLYRAVEPMLTRDQLESVRRAINDGCSLIRNRLQ